MTIGVLVSPAGQPALLADTMGFLEGADNHSGLPARLDFSDIHAMSGLPLYRKAIIINDNVAMTVAGAVDSIVDFVSNCRSLAAAYDLGELDGHILALSSSAQNVQAIVAITKAISDGCETRVLCINVLDKHKVSLGTLGNTFAIGSGADDAILKATDYDHQAQNFDPLSKRSFELISSFSHFMSGVKLRNEMFTEESLSWGGFLEYVWFDVRAGKWVRGPRALYISVRIVLLAGARYSTGLYGYTFAYEPGTVHGSIFTNEFAADGRAGFESAIQDITSREPIESLGSDFWYNWRPDTANIALIPDIITPKFKPCHCTTVDDEIDGIIWQIGAENQNGFGFTDDLIDYYAERAYRHTGWTYVPVRDLS